MPRHRRNNLAFYLPQGGSFIPPGYERPVATPGIVFPRLRLYLYNGRVWDYKTVPVKRPIGEKIRLSTWRLLMSGVAKEGISSHRLLLKYILHEYAGITIS